MFNRLFGFIFGRKPKIFDKEGQVRHELGKEKWDAWQARYSQGDEYNWRNHTGMRAKDSQSPRKTKS